MNNLGTHIMASTQIAAVPHLPTLPFYLPKAPGAECPAQPQHAKVPAKLLYDAKLPKGISRVDPGKTSSPSLQGAYLCVLDDVLTLDECHSLISAVEVRASGSWAEVRETYEENSITSARNCDRIICDSPELVGELWARIESLVPELRVWTPQHGAEKWPMTRLNERTRFLRYRNGQYFQPHADCYYETPGGEERSFITLHLFLNDEGSDSQLDAFTGGSTTFYSADLTQTFTVPAKAGRVLLFQQESLLHSANEVMQGTKFTMRTDVMYARP